MYADKQDGILIFIESERDRRQNHPESLNSLPRMLSNNLPRIYKYFFIAGNITLFPSLLCPLISVLRNRKFFAN